jgi:hypothetical protein
MLSGTEGKGEEKDSGSMRKMSLVASSPLRGHQEAITNPSIPTIATDSMIPENLK